MLAGYDDQLAYLSDTGFTELQTTRLENLARARHGQHPVFPLAGHMFTLPAGVEAGEVRAGADAAIARAAAQMIEPPMGEYEGLPALRRFAVEVGHWPEQIDDWQWCARFCYQVIERRGTGGGNFRLMYSRFLAEVGREQASLAAEAAGRWTELALALQAASEADSPDPGLWSSVGRHANAVLDVEERLWPALAGASL